VGYYTDHNLKIDGPPDKIKEFKEFVKQHKEDTICENYSYSDVHAIIDDWNQSKWYDLVEDFTKISTDWPSLKFTVHCKGEDGVEWIQNFWAGKSREQNSHLVWDKFDFSEIDPLKEKLDAVINE